VLREVVAASYEPDTSPQAFHRSSIPLNHPNEVSIVMKFSLHVEINNFSKDTLLMSKWEGWNVNPGRLVSEHWVSGFIPSEVTLGSTYPMANGINKSLHNKFHMFVQARHKNTSFFNLLRYRIKSFNKKENIT
jgi:hypothetical protein